MGIRVSDYIARHLAEEGVPAAFILSGGGMMHLIDALGREGKIKYYCNHHEQASAMAAEGYARKSGSLGLCYATSGPGGTNLLTGLLGAWLDSVPVLFITGQSNLARTIEGSGISGLRQFGTFEVNIVPIVESVTKYSVFINDPKLIRYHLEKAIYMATHGRPGPVLIDIPLDMQAAEVNVDELVGFIPPEEAVMNLSDSILNEILLKLQSAERPLLLAGHGINCADCGQLFRDTIKTIDIPVITTQLAKDLLPYTSPHFVGHPGVKGDRAGNFAVQNADVILSIGCSLHEQTTGYEPGEFAPNAYKIQIEIDGAVLKRENIGVTMKVQCSVESFLEKANCVSPFSKSVAQKNWSERCLFWKERYAVSHEPHLLNDGPINFYDFADHLSVLAGENATIVTDAGTAFYIMGQAFRLKEGQRYIVSGALGAMGYALPAGIGVCVADLSREVICVTGDGSLQTNIHELQVARHYNLNLKLFVINNRGYVSIRNTQKTFFDGHYVGSSYDSGVSMPSLEKVAESYGLPYIECRDRSKLKDCLALVLSMSGPVLCVIWAQADQKVMPSVSSKVLPNGSMKSMPLHEMFPFLDEKEIATNMNS